MTHHVNELGQPIGFAIENFIAPARPNFNRLLGNFVRVESISMDHLSSLYCNSSDTPPSSGHLNKKYES